MTWRERLTQIPGERNNPQDPRFLAGHPGVPRLRRGMIRNIRPRRSETAVVEHLHRFHFMTNPWEISTSYTVHEAIDITDPANQEAMMRDIPPMVDGLISVSFQMLLDRTYEVWSGTLPEGVLHDMAQLERVFGLPDRDALEGGGPLTPEQLGGPLSGDQSGVDRSPVPALYNQFPGVIVKRPLRFMFGGPTQAHAYSFDGYVTSLSITMMKFSTNMVPTRAGIDISATTWGEGLRPTINNTRRLEGELGGPLSGDQSGLGG